MSGGLLDSVTSGAVAGGALLVLIGSCNQAWGNLIQYRDLVTTAELDVNRQLLKFVSRPDRNRASRALKLLSLAGVGLSMETPGEAPRLPAGRPAGQPAAGGDQADVGPTQQVGDAETEATAHTDAAAQTAGQAGARKAQMKQALNVATAWGLILFGSLAAFLASVVQFVQIVR